MVRDRKLGPARGELRIQLNGPLDESNRFLGRRRLEIVAQLAGAQHQIVGLWGGGRPRLDVFRRCDVEGSEDLMSNIVQYGEAVAERPIVALAPDRIACLAVDQPGIDLDTPVRAAGAPVKHVAYVKLSRDLRIVRVPPPIGEA
jgi:hypothetical protein